MKDAFREKYGRVPEIFASACGRVEVLGNHTDHQGGQAIGAAINLRVNCAAAKRDDKEIRMFSEGFGDFKAESITGTPGAFAFGILEYFEKEFDIFRQDGLDIYIKSEVPSGFGLSSSAAFALALARIFNKAFGQNKITPLALARAAQYAENRRYGKPCGLLDQATSALGGLVALDFSDSDFNGEIKFEKLDFDKELKICVTLAGGDHAGLTANYAAIREEMNSVAAEFGEETLLRVNTTDFYWRIGELRKKLGDRACLRAWHFFKENSRVARAKEALKRGNTPEFLKLINESGDSSYKALQNVYENNREQPLALALILGRAITDANGGAIRIHGGGFAGTVIAFMKNDCSEYIKVMESVFGSERVKILEICDE